MFNDASSSGMFANVRLRGARCGEPQAACAPEQLPHRPHHPDRLSRAVEIPIAMILLAAMLPALLLIALAIWAGDGGSPLFAHRRIGRGGARFPCLKFRTMVRDSHERLQRHLAADPAAALEWQHSQKLRHDPRITPLGRFLRKTSLDEIPQLANVVMGHMSLVGPRPIVEDEIIRYRHYFARYCSVRPGITGLWQVSGRNDISYRRRVALDIAYCRAKSLPLDLAILARTVPAVMSGRGCS